MFSEALDAALTAYEHRDKLREAAHWLWARIAKGEANVVVFGSAGAGKSTLGAVLAGREVGPDYDDSTHLETYRMAGGVPCSILVPPGQASARAATWTDLLRKVATGRASTVLHVVSWGLTPIGDRRFSEVPGYEPEMSVEALAERYFSREREREVETLEHFASQLELAPSKLSLVTVVLKQDLWWGERSQVRDFYEGGAYAETIERLRNHVGAQNFSHKLWSASLLRRNITDNQGIPLRVTAAGYDDVISARHERKLLDIIRAEVEHG